MNRIKLSFFMVLCSLLNLLPGVTYAQTSSIISVNYANDQGESNQVASGLLHGISANYPAQYLIDGINIRAIRGADYHKNLPGYYEQATYARAKATGAKLMIGLYYYVVNDSYRPGDNGDWEKWRNICRGVYAEAQSKNYDVYSWITWNEPRLQWGDINNYFEAHHVAYDAIKSRNSSARVQAPEDHAYNLSFMSDFLTFCKNNNCLPDILTWHELSQDPLDIEAHCKEIKNWMQNNGITPMPMAVTEYQGSSYSNDNTSIPGVNVYYLASMERAVQHGFEFGLHAAWTRSGDDADFIATLADMADKESASLPRGLWWNYNAYKDMTGRKVQINVSGSNSDALAGTDSDMNRSIILIGTRNYVTAHNVSLTMNNIPGYLVHNGRVHIRAEMIRNAMVLMSPEIMLAGDYSLSGSSVSLSLPIMEPKAAYMIYVSPATEDAPKRYFEAESLSTDHTSGRAFYTYAESSASNGQAVALESTANSDYLEFRIPAPGSGIYNLTATMKRLNNRGFIQLYINGQNVCPPEDEYGVTAEYYDNDFGNIKVGSGDLNLRFVIVGRNSNSDNSWMVFDRFILTKTSGSSVTDPPTPTPTSTPVQTLPPVILNPGTTYGFQAEDVPFFAAVIESIHTGYSGSGYMNYENAIGGYIEWTVSAGSFTQANLVFVFANGGSDGRPCEVSVNGSTAASLDFPATGAWTTWKAASASVNLNSGTNTIRLTCTGSEGGPNIDRMDIKVSGGSGMQGDVNTDKTITIVDALMIAQYSVGLSPAGFDAAQADVNCDGSVTIVDALIVAQRYVGSIKEFPC